MAFVPSPSFWQTMIRMRLEWAARLDSLNIPVFSLQFLDIIKEDHPLIKASVQGDLAALEHSFSRRDGSIQRASPFCSTRAGWTPLHFAAAYGQLDACRLLIEQGAPLDATGFRGITPLHLAAHFGRFEVFKALLKAGSDPDDYHEHGMNAVLEIMSNEKVSMFGDLIDLLKWLLHGQEQFKLDAQATDNSQRGILYHLTYPPGRIKGETETLTTKQRELVGSLLREGVKGDEPDVYGLSVLHEACCDDRLDLVETLLKGNGDINARDGRGYTPLFHAVETGNFQLVSTLVSCGADTSAVAEEELGNWSGLSITRSPLNLAVNLDSVEMLEFLIQHGADSSKQSMSDAVKVAVKERSRDVLHYLIDNATEQLDLRYTILLADHNISVIDVLYKAGAPLDDSYENEHGWTPLTRAAILGWEHVVKKLIEYGVDLDKTSMDLTALGWAAQSGHSNVVHILLAAGADTGLTGSKMPSPWQLAKNNGFGEIANAIERQTCSSPANMLKGQVLRDVVECEVDAVTTILKEDLNMIEAVRNGDLEVVERLMKRGCNLNTGKGYGWSPLSMAIALERWEIARMLVEAGAELNMVPKQKRDDLNYMPFMEAVVHGNLDFIELMIRRGADVNIRGEHGSTPLLQSLDRFCSHYTCYSNGEIVQALLSAGADPKAVDDFGRTAIGKAAAIGNSEAVIALVKAGADLDKASSQNYSEHMNEWVELVYRTPLGWAALMGHEDIVKFLFESGAEWRSIRREPALSYTHNLLMESWFPAALEAGPDAVDGVDMLIMPPRDTIVDNGRLPVERSNGEPDSAPMNHQGSRQGGSLFKATNLFTNIVKMIQALALWVQGLNITFQSIRLEVAMFAGVSLLLLARAAIQFCSITRLADLRLAVMAILLGILVASWSSQSGGWFQTRSSRERDIGSTTHLCKPGQSIAPHGLV